MLNRSNSETVLLRNFTSCTVATPRLRSDNHPQFAIPTAKTFRHRRTEERKVPMKTNMLTLLGSIILLPALAGMAATRYVNVSNPAPSPPYTSWANAATNIQDAIDVAADGDSIWVTNGVYASGGLVVYGSLTNRVAITKAVTVQSVNGPAATRIVGSGPVGPSAVRCVYMTNTAVLAGFTLTNGATQTGGDDLVNRSGGGVWSEASTAIVSNCMLTGNAAAYGGGAAYSATLDHCTLTGNSASEGGGAYSGTLTDCVLRGNSASFVGGGAIGATLCNCVLIGNLAVYGGGANNCAVFGSTLVGNSASSWGGGAYYGSLFNSIAYYNQAVEGPNYYSSSATYSCTTPPLAGSGNLTNAPLFVNTNGWTDLRLQSGSPCINAGNNAYVVGTVDLAGSPRILEATVDMGAYEWFALPTPLAFTCARWLSNAMELQFTGETNRVVEIHAATDLTSWTWLVTLTNETGQLLYSDPQATNYMRRFYRGIQLP
jgi:hypothetical protein